MTPPPLLPVHRPGIVASRLYSSGTSASPSTRVRAPALSPRQPAHTTGRRMLQNETVHDRDGQPTTAQLHRFQGGQKPQNSPLSHSSAFAMSTMPSSHGHSEACCNIPPIISSGYEPKGTYEDLGGMKTYVTGPADATRGIVSIFDIFGFFDQTIQGADILTASGKYRVFMPDWFNGRPCPIEWYPPDTEEKQKELGEWFGKHAPQDVAEALPAYVDALQAANPSIRSWCLFGYCWGGKVVELVTSSSKNPFQIAGSAHPAMIDPKGAEGVSVPYVLIASKEEPADTIKDFQKRLTQPNHVETFGDQVHGFMAARADLNDPHVRDEYRRGYKVVLKFLDKNWA